MPFVSKYAPVIWNRLYTVLIPDQVTLSKDYIKKFGVYVTGNKEVDEMLSKNQTCVMIPIATILEYFENGVEIQIPSRQDMIQIYKDIEAYLEEWREHIKYDINLPLQQHKDLILALEKLSKHIYEKIRPKELVDNLFRKEKIGIINPLQKIQEEEKEVVKPDYEGIGKLIRSRINKPVSRF